MKSRVFSLFILVAALCAFDALAVSGRTHAWFGKSFVPLAGGTRVMINIPANSIAAAAFDGERFLVAYTVDLVLHAGIFREGMATPDVTIRLGAGPGEGTPAVTWDGTRYVVVWNETAGAAR